MTSKELRALRLRLGLTQDQLATQLGITRGQVTKLENGNSTITPTMEKLVTLLHL